MNTMRFSAGYWLRLAPVFLLLLSACSRPYATYQANTAVPRSTVSVVPTLAPVQASTQESLTLLPALDRRLDTLVRNDNTLVSSRFQKRMTHVRAVLAAQPLTMAIAPKMNLVKKMMLRRLTKTVRQQQGHNINEPSNTQAFRLGLIVAAGGLLLVIIGNPIVSTIGGIALLGGLTVALLAFLEII